jgi:hypothetical protein
MNGMGGIDRRRDTAGKRRQPLRTCTSLGTALGQLAALTTLGRRSAGKFMLLYRRARDHFAGCGRGRSALLASSTG